MSRGVAVRSDRAPAPPVPAVAVLSLTVLSLTVLSIVFLMLTAPFASASPSGVAHAVDGVRTTRFQDDPEQPAEQPSEQQETESSEPPATTTTSVVVPRTTVPALEERVTESEAATTRLNLAVIGLIFLAVVISGVTVYFWFCTRPGRVGRSQRRRGATIVASDGTEQPMREQSVGDFFSSHSEGP